MNSNTRIYVKKFEELLLVEQKARDFYKYYLGQISDPFLLSGFQKMHEEESKHVEIVKNLIKILS